MSEDLYQKGYVSVTLGRTVNVGNYENVKVSVTLGQECDAAERREVHESLVSAGLRALRVQVGELVPEDHEEASEARKAAYQERVERERAEEERLREQSRRDRERKAAEEREWEAVWCQWDQKMDGWNDAARAERQRIMAEELERLGEAASRDDLATAVEDRMGPWLEAHPRPAVPLHYPSWEQCQGGARVWERRKDAWNVARVESGGDVRDASVTEGEPRALPPGGDGGGDGADDDIPF